MALVIEDSIDSFGEPGRAHPLLGIEHLLVPTKYPTFCEKSDVRHSQSIFLVFTTQTFDMFTMRHLAFFRYELPVIMTTPTNIDPENPETHGRVYARWNENISSRLSSRL